jgi:hypothetical protein
MHWLKPSLKLPPRLGKSARILSPAITSMIGCATAKRCRYRQRLSTSFIFIALPDFGSRCFEPFFWALAICLVLA